MSKSVFESLTAVNAEPAGVARFKAAMAYMHRAEKAVRDGRSVRDSQVRELVVEHGAAETHRLTGMPLATIKAIARGVHTKSNRSSSTE